jgi:uncharacterized protein YyaL (SSP411 family)
MPEFTNRLINETSPYLLQHAHNPVDWYSWGDEAWNKAKAENKLVIISIGYSACHWCHVMEHESFEDNEVARLMNKDYICIKVDREERPDVDQFFMDAVNIMSGRGGWPLNAFALPDGRPVYVGTYFPKTSWTGLLHEIASGYKFRTKYYLEYADKIVAGIRGLSLIKLPETIEEFPVKMVDNVYLSFSNLFDRTNGGKGVAPKFPMPDIYNFLLQYNYHSGNNEALAHTLLTLDKMAMGGIYDQLGGGFARYSTDEEWKVPHFEKMLYDNAQLIGLYADAYSITKKTLYKDVVISTISWIEREMLSPGGGFYSALDADSEGEEGRFYVWTQEEFEAVLGEDFSLATKYYGIGGKGYWEKGNNILVIPKSNSELAVEFNMGEAELEAKLADISAKLFKARENRIKPGLDNKILTSWNALMIKGLVKAYNALGDAQYLSIARNNLNFILGSFFKKGALLHTVKKDNTYIPGFLEDYAYLIDALIEFYQATFEEQYIIEAQKLLAIVLHDFYDDNSGYFFFTSALNSELANRKIDNSDNVISSPNSVMAHNLFRLGRLLYNDEYIDKSKRMLSGVIENLLEYGPFYSNWGSLLLNFSYPFHELVICGENALVAGGNILSNYIPGKLIAGGTVKNTSNIPILEGKSFQPGMINFYICVNKLCQSPVQTIEECIAALKP